MSATTNFDVLVKLLTIVRGVLPGRLDYDRKSRRYEEMSGILTEWWNSNHADVAKSVPVPGDVPYDDYYNGPLNTKRDITLANLAWRARVGLDPETERLILDAADELVFLRAYKQTESARMEKMRDTLTSVVQHKTLETLVGALRKLLSPEDFADFIKKIDPDTPLRDFVAYLRGDRACEKSK